MRVLVVTNMYPTPDMPHFGIFVQEQVESLRRRGAEVDVLFINGKRSKLEYAGGACRVRQQVRRKRYDIVHAHYVFAGWMARAQFSAPLVVSFHGAGEMFSWVGWLCKRLAPLVDAYTVTSQEHAGQIGRDDAHIIPCGIDTELLRPIPMAEARAALDLDPTKKLVLFAADLRPEKRLDVAQAAMSLLHKRGIDADLMVVTNQPHGKMPLFMNACNVMVLTSDAEGSPQTIKEAMACNLPIVSVDVGDVVEVIEGVEGCYLCERTPEDVAAKLAEALARGQRTHGRQAVTELSLDHIAQRMLDLYAKVLQARRRPTPELDT